MNLVKIVLYNNTLRHHDDDRRVSERETCHIDEKNTQQ